MTNRNFVRTLPAIALGVLAASAAWQTAAQQARTPSSVNESAPARSADPRLPAPGSHSAYPTNTPSMVNESAPARTGASGTPTGGQGYSAHPPLGATEPLNRLPQTASSVSESAPARTGPGTVPSARFTRMWDIADANNDGVVDRFEFDRWMLRGETARR